MDDLYKLVGKRIKRLRSRRHMLQSELAEEAGLSRASISNIETGRQQLYLHHLYAIALALGSTPSSLLEAADPPTDPQQRRLLESLRGGKPERTSGGKP